MAIALGDTKQPTTRGCPHQAHTHTRQGGIKIVAIAVSHYLSISLVRRRAALSPLPGTLWP
jgi:hypothetical protein